MKFLPGSWHYNGTMLVPGGFNTTVKYHSQTFWLTEDKNLHSQSEVT